MLIRERNEILGTINAILEAERGNTLSEDQLLIECELDSFSYAVFWMTLAEHGMDIQDEWIDAIDYSTLKVSDIIDRIVEG